MSVCLSCYRVLKVSNSPWFPTEDQPRSRVLLHARCLHLQDSGCCRLQVSLLWLLPTQRPRTVDATDAMETSTKMVADDALGNASTLDVTAATSLISTGMKCIFSNSRLGIDTWAKSTVGKVSGANLLISRKYSNVLIITKYITHAFLSLAGFGFTMLHQGDGRFHRGVLEHKNRRIEWWRRHNGVTFGCDFVMFRYVIVVMSNLLCHLWRICNEVVMKLWIVMNLYDLWWKCSLYGIFWRLLIRGGNPKQVDY
jgi:hypothetical protein